MDRDKSFELSRLAGFEQVAGDGAEALDFRACATDARLGAKRAAGGEPTAAPADRQDDPKAE